MAPRVTITESEITAALASAIEGSAPDDAKTVAEMCLMFGKHRTTVERALRELMLAGRLEVHQVPRQTISGTWKRVPAYTIKPRSKRKP